MFIKDIVWITIEIQGGKNNDIVGADQIYLYQLYQYNKGNDCMSGCVCMWLPKVYIECVSVYIFVSEWVGNWNCHCESVNSMYSPQQYRSLLCLLIQNSTQYNQKSQHLFYLYGACGVAKTYCYSTLIMCLLSLDK